MTLSSGNVQKLCEGTKYNKKNLKKNGEIFEKETNLTTNKWFRFDLKKLGDMSHPNVHGISPSWLTWWSTVAWRRLRMNSSMCCPCTSWTTQTRAALWRASGTSWGQAHWRCWLATPRRYTHASYTHTHFFLTTVCLENGQPSS